MAGINEQLHETNPPIEERVDQLTNAVLVLLGVCGIILMKDRKPRSDLLAVMTEVSGTLELWRNLAPTDPSHMKGG